MCNLFWFLSRLLGTLLGGGGAFLCGDKGIEEGEMDEIRRGSEANVNDEKEEVVGKGVVGWSGGVIYCRGELKDIV